MEERKYEAIKALDEALDAYIIALAEDFVKDPSFKTLSKFNIAITADEYCDEYLECEEDDSMPELEDDDVPKK
jgi:hypothetical protein